MTDPLAPFRLDGRVAIVTGASSGIGTRFARVLDAAGAKVVVAARRADRLDALVKELDNGTAVACDVSVDADVDRLVSATLEEHGQVDVLVNNAGVGEPSAAEDEPLDHFRQAVAVNL